jgi:hypothetical protein
MFLQRKSTKSDITLFFGGDQSSADFHFSQPGIGTKPQQKAEDEATYEISLNLHDNCIHKNSHIT